MAIEIERKWLIHDAASVPTLDFHRTEHIRQAYILDRDKHVLRVRTSIVNVPSNPVVKNFTEATVTVKGPSQVDFPDEYEMKIPFMFGEKFMENCIVLEKTRKTFTVGNDINVELDFFTSDALKGLIVAEIEFNSSHTAGYFIPLSWFGEEVTYNSKYSNASLYKTLGA